MLWIGQTYSIVARGTSSGSASKLLDCDLQNCSPVLREVQIRNPVRPRKSKDPEVEGLER